MVHQLHQLGVDGLIGFLQHFDQLPGLLEVARGEEGVGSALVGAPGRSANAVHVILRAVWIVIVDHKLDIFHIFNANDESVQVDVAGKEKVKDMPTTGGKHNAGDSKRRED